MRRFRPPLLPLAAAAGFAGCLAGCATFPELDATVTDEAKAAPRPVLVDNAPILAAASAVVIEPDLTTDLQGRAAGLRGRSEAAAGPVIPPDEAARIAQTAERLREEASRVAPQS